MNINWLLIFLQEFFFVEIRLITKYLFSNFHYAYCFFTCFKYHQYRSDCFADFCGRKSLLSLDKICLFFQILYVFWCLLILAQDKQWPSRATISASNLLSFFAMTVLKPMLYCIQWCLWTVDSLDNNWQNALKSVFNIDGTSQNCVQW